MNSIFLDIETLSRNPDAIITEIGLVAVDSSTCLPNRSLAYRPCLAAQLLAGRHACPETIAWHRKQGTLPHPDHLTDCPDFVCSEIVSFFEIIKPRHIWIQGPDFDRPILESFMKTFDHDLPWKYWQVRDARTVWEIAFPGEKRAKRPHLAVEDCTATFHDTVKALTQLGCLSEI